MGALITPERIPELATTWPRRVRASASTSSPTRKLEVDAQRTAGVSSGCCRRSTTRSVLGSRPLTPAESLCPGAVITVISSSRRTAWLAATTASLAITMPLEGWRVPCTATTDLPAVAETSARSFESLLQIFSIQISSLVFPLFFQLQYERIVKAGASAIWLGLAFILKTAEAGIKLLREQAADSLQS